MKLLVFFVSALISVHALDVPTLSLSASATIWKPSDELQLKIGVVTLGVSAQEALAENSSKMRGVIQNLEVIGLSGDDYETSNFSINPTYTPCPKDPPPSWRQTINGYEVTNTILIRTPKLDLAGSIIDSANKAGANSITDIRFGLRHARDHWSEALTQAGLNAVSDAQAIARATGVRLVRVRSITLNSTQVHSPQLNLAGMAKCAQSTPIEPGEVSITANVTLLYEID